MSWLLMICEERSLQDDIKQVFMSYVPMEHCPLSLLTQSDTKIFFWEVWKDVAVGKFKYHVVVPAGTTDSSNEFFEMQKHAKVINTTHKLGSPTLVLHVKIQ